MGIYLNPDEKLFSMAAATPLYVDKTELIVETNALVNTMKRFLCVSRPRRFGKSITAAMLAAYYGCGEDRRRLFENRKLKEYQNALNYGAKSVLPPTTEPWGQRTCYVADPDGNLIEIGSFVKE